MRPSLSAIASSRRGARSVGRIVDAAARMFGRSGFQGASMGDVAREAGVSKGLLHYHFDSKEQLLLQAMRATFKQVHQRFSERFERGDRGLETALEAFDALWDTLRDLSGFAPFMVELVRLANRDDVLRSDLFAFYAESEQLLARGAVEALDGRGVVPPERLARLVRLVMHGLVVELSFARTEAERAEVEQAYRDLRTFFRAASSPPPEVNP